MTIVWHTNRACVSRVEYGAGEELGMSAVNSRNGLIDNDKTSHVIRLTGLKPGTRYKYRVISKEFGGYIQQHIVTFGETVSSPVHEFTTPDPRKSGFSFAMVSDIHERARDLETMLDQKAFAGVDFAIYNGDMLNDFMKADQVFTGFLDVTIRKFAGTLPFVYARGNHETRGRFARTLPDYLPTMDGRTYYSFDHGGVHFIILDSGEDKEDAHPYYNGLVDFQSFRKEQAEWLKRDLAGEASMAASFRIVISHIPPRGGKGFAIEDVCRNFEPLVNKAGVDLWLSGHTHRYQRVDPAPGQNGYPLIIGSTDTITRVDVSRAGVQVSVARLSGEMLLPPLQLKRRGSDRQPAS
jgi:predicted phosphodiesterase